MNFVSRLVAGSALLVISLSLVACNKQAADDAAPVDTTLNDVDESDPAVGNTDFGLEAQAPTPTQSSPHIRDRQTSMDDVEEEDDHHATQALHEPSRARPLSSYASLISSDDYPSSAMDNNEQGTVRVQLVVGPSGRVAGCSVAVSSGSQALDLATCRILSARARYEPATDADGTPISDNTTATVSWRLD